MDVDSLPLSLLELAHSRVTTFVLCLQEEERREAVAVAREEEERAKELQKLARLQVKLSSFPDSPEQDHGVRPLKGINAPFSPYTGSEGSGYCSHQKELGGHTPASVSQFSS